MRQETPEPIFKCDACGKRTETLLSIRHGRPGNEIANAGEICWKCFLGWCADYNVSIAPFPRLCNDPDHV
jgi:hypothetical protein